MSAHPQISVSELFSEVKDAMEANRQMLTILDRYDLEEQEALQNASLEVANMLSRHYYELYHVQKTIGVAIESNGGRPKVTLYDVQEGCGTH